MPFENNSCRGRYEKLYVLYRSNLCRGDELYDIRRNRLGATEATNTAIPAAARSKVRVGTTERNTDFQASIWSVRFIGQMTSPCSINGQSVIPPDISIPIDIWNKLMNITPRSKVSVIAAINFIVKLYRIFYSFEPASLKNDQVCSPITLSSAQRYQYRRGFSGYSVGRPRTTRFSDGSKCINA